jgi:hypothetical protein
MSELAGKRPYQSDDFLKENRGVITSVFPDFFEVDVIENETHDAELQYKTLEDKVLALTAHDPAMQLLGRERFAELPQTQRFQIVKDSLLFVQAIHEAEKALE